MECRHFTAGHPRSFLRRRVIGQRRDHCTGAFKHPQKNIILRAVGAEDELEVDCFTLELTADTKLLLCSDGLSDMVDDRQISEILQAHQTAEAAEVLLEAALDNGGRDNISLILIDLTPTEEDNRS